MNPHIATSDEPVDFLHLKSGVNKARLHSVRIGDVLIVDDCMLDGRAVSALARSAFGRDTEVRHATSLMRAKNMLLERMPELIVLDDILPPKDRAETSIAYLRQSGFSGSIVVISGEMTRLRRLKLLQAGAAGVVHKDDLNATSLAEAAIPVADPAGNTSVDADEVGPARRRSSNDDVP